MQFFLGGGRMCIFIASAALHVMAPELQMFLLEVPPPLLFGPLHLFKGDRVAEMELVASPDT